MGTKNNPKSEFDTVFALLNKPSLFNLQWPIAVRLAKTRKELNQLEALAVETNHEALLVDLFPPRMALVETCEDVACLVTQYPAYAGRIYEWVQKQQLTEADVEMLVVAFPEWREALYGQLLHVANASLSQAVEELAKAEDKVAEARESWGYSAAVARRFHDFAVEELRRAEQTFRKAEELDANVKTERARYEDADTAYRSIMEQVRDSRITVTRVARGLCIEEGPFVRQLSDLSIEDMMEGAAFEDRQPVMPVDMPVTPVSDEAQPASVDLFDAPAEPLVEEVPTPGTNAQVSSLLDEHRPRRVVTPDPNLWRRFQNWLDAK